MNRVNDLAPMTSLAFERALRDALGGDAVTNDAESLKHYGRDWIKDFAPAPSLIVFPTTAAQVVSIVKLCLEHDVPIVPSGGRTGLSGGATAVAGEVVVSLERMRKVLSVNATDRTIRCEAGVPLERLQQEAEKAGLYFPVDFSSRGSSQIGGNIATNAGGIRVIRYGNIRESVIGLKVVTGTGELLELNGSLFKNNTGYDLRSLFIGSEGTLGIIVECTMKLTSPPGDLTRVLCGLESSSSILPLLERCRSALRDLSAFEFMERDALEEVVKRRGLRDPFERPYPFYVLVEIEENSAATRDAVMTTFGEIFEAGVIQDVVVSESRAQAQELMNLRDLVSETLSSHYTLHKNDISVPVPTIPEFLEALHRSIAEIYPTFKVVVFGHVGDGNLHVNVLKPEGLSDADFWSMSKEADIRVFTLVQQYHGSVSAEHGVGLLKRDFLRFSRSEAERALMLGIKSVFDPKRIMNPGKVLVETSRSVTSA